MTKFGNRLELASGLAITTKMDTVVTGNGSGLPPLTNTGVPYIYVDNGVRNNFRYFYVVTAFDVNSWSSGPTSLESPKAGTQSVIPQALASNLVQTGTLTPGMFGGSRAPGQPNTTNQSLVFPKTPGMNLNGTFTGPFPPATVQLGFVGFASQVVGGSGALAVTLDSMDMGNVDLSGCCGGGAPAIPGVYYFTLSNGDPVDDFQLAVPLTQDLAADVSTDVYFAGPAIDADLASMYGGDATYGSLSALFQPTLTSGPNSGDWGLGSQLQRARLHLGGHAGRRHRHQLQRHPLVRRPLAAEQRGPGQPDLGLLRHRWRHGHGLRRQRHHRRLQQRRPAGRGDHGLPAAVATTCTTVSGATWARPRRR